MTGPGLELMLFLGGRKREETASLGMSEVGGGLEGRPRVKEPQRETWRAAGSRRGAKPFPVVR